MRAIVMAIPLAVLGTPALSQVQPAPATAPAAATAPVPETITLPPQLTDPRLTDRLVDMMEVMSDAFLDLPVGELAAAAEGRKPTRADKRRTVRTETRMSERQMRQQIEQARPVMHAGMRAMAKALPAMMKTVSEAAREMEQATANLPSPTYPKR